MSSRLNTKKKWLDPQRRKIQEYMSNGTLTSDKIKYKAGKQFQVHNMEAAALLDSIRLAHPELYENFRKYDFNENVRKMMLSSAETTTPVIPVVLSPKSQEYFDKELKAKREEQLAEVEVQVIDSVSEEYQGRMNEISSAVNDVSASAVKIAENIPKISENIALLAGAIQTEQEQTNLGMETLQGSSDNLGKCSESLSKEKSLVMAARMKLQQKRLETQHAKEDREFYSAKKAYEAAHSAKKDLKEEKAQEDVDGEESDRKPSPKKNDGVGFMDLGRRLFGYNSNTEEEETDEDLEPAGVPGLDPIDEEDVLEDDVLEDSNGAGTNVIATPAVKVTKKGSVRRSARTPGSKESNSTSTPKSKGSAATSTPRKIAAYSTSSKIATTPSDMVNTPRRSTRSASKRGVDEANVPLVEVSKKQKVSSAKKPAAKKVANPGPKQPTISTPRKLTKAEKLELRKNARESMNKM